MENTLTDRLPQLNIKTVDTTVALAETDVLVSELTKRLAKVERLAYTQTN